MEAIHKIYEQAPAMIPIPKEIQNRRVEIIIVPLDEQKSEPLDANGYPVGFFEETFGSLPDFPEREPQRVSMKCVRNQNELSFWTVMLASVL